MKASRKAQTAVKGMPSVKEVVDTAARLQRPLKVKAVTKISVKPGKKQA